jgi:hypothetical protein
VTTSPARRPGRPNPGDRVVIHPALTNDTHESRRPETNLPEGELTPDFPSPVMSWSAKQIHPVGVRQRGSEVDLPAQHTAWRTLSNPQLTDSADRGSRQGREVEGKPWRPLRPLREAPVCGERGG